MVKWSFISDVTGSIQRKTILFYSEIRGNFTELLIFNCFLFLVLFGWEKGDTESESHSAAHASLELASQPWEY